MADHHRSRRVAFADLLPLVGATLGALVGVLAAYLHSPTAGLISLIFFVVYQQVENGMIYPWLMARKVKINPLSVLLSVLLAVVLPDSMLDEPAPGGWGARPSEPRSRHHGCGWSSGHPVMRWNRALPKPHDDRHRPAGLTFRGQ